MVLTSGLVATQAGFSISIGFPLPPPPPLIIRAPVVCPPSVYVTPTCPPRVVVPYGPVYVYPNHGPGSSRHQPGRGYSEAPGRRRGHHH